MHRGDDIYEISQETNGVRERKKQKKKCMGFCFRDVAKSAPYKTKRFFIKSKKNI